MMRDEVNKIVFNELASGRALWLPEVGAFVPEYRSALRASSRRLEPPGHRVVFLSGRKGASLIDLISRAGGCDLAAAEDIYARWLAQVRTDDGLAIEGVGRLEHRYFNAAEPLDAILCPLGREPLTLHPRRSRVALWATCGLIAAAFVVYGVRWYGARERIETGAAAHAELPVASPLRELPERSVGGIVVPDALETEVPEEADAGSVGEEAALQSEAETAVFPTEAAAASELLGDLPVARMQAGRTYVVWGVYTTEENARRAVAEHRRERPDLSYRIYRFGPKWMISLFESDAPEECRAYLNGPGRALEGLWSYTKKG